MAKRDPRLKAYVKYDKLGQVVPGSLILRRTPPEGGRDIFWKEIVNDECCTINISTFSFSELNSTNGTLTINVNGTTTTSTTTETGTFVANAGNFVQVTNANGSTYRTLTVTDSDGTVLFTGASQTAAVTYNFTATLDHTYNVVATVNTTTTTTTTTTTSTTTTTTTTP